MIQIIERRSFIVSDNV